MYEYDTYDYQQSDIKKSKCTNMDMEPYNIQPTINNKLKQEILIADRSNQ